jgi:hypothetical protein
MVECDKICKAAQVASVVGIVSIILTLVIIFNM